MEMNLNSLKDISLEKIGTELFDNYVNVFKNGVNFKTRATKYEYWGFSFVNEVLFLILSVLSFIPLFSKISYSVTLAYYVLYLLPAIALFIRRLHDTGRSALHLLYAFLLAVGGIVIVISGMVLLKDNNTNLAYSIGYVYGSLCIVVVFIYFFILTLLPSTPDNKYGIQPQISSAQKTLANLFIIAVIALRILIVSGSYYYQNHFNVNVNSSLNSALQMHSHIQ